MSKRVIEKLKLLNWKEPYPAQKRFLNNFCDRNWFIGGRGTGKTQTCVVRNAIVSLFVNPGETSLIYESTYDDIKFVLLPLFRSTIPPELYTYKVADKVIEWVNGSKTLLRSVGTQGGRSNFSLGRGYSVSSIIIDEAAKISDDSIYLQLEGALRTNNPKSKLMLDIVTTPKICWVHTLAEKFGIENTDKKYLYRKAGPLNISCVYASSLENPYNQGLGERLLYSYDEKFAKQEVFGYWVPQGEGLVFETFSSQKFPLGNLIEYEFDPDKPYYLSIDIGSANNSTLVYQKKKIDGIQRHIVVSEFNSVGGLDGILNHIRGQFTSIPKAIYIGHDAGNRDLNSGFTSHMIVNKHYGYSVNLIPLNKFNQSPDYRYSRMRHAIKDIQNNRRLLVSTSLWNAKEGLEISKRGIRAMFQQYAYPDRNYKQEYVLPRDRKFEHVADSLSFYLANENDMDANSTIGA